MAFFSFLVTGHPVKVLSNNIETFTIRDSFEMEYHVNKNEKFRYLILVAFNQS